MLAHPDEVADAAHCHREVPVAGPFVPSLLPDLSCLGPALIAWTATLESVSGRHAGCGSAGLVMAWGWPQAFLGVL